MLQVEALLEALVSVAIIFLTPPLPQDWFNEATSLLFTGISGGALSSSSRLSGLSLAGYGQAACHTFCGPPGGPTTGTATRGTGSPLCMWTSRPSKSSPTRTARTVSQLAVVTTLRSSVAAPRDHC
ncbi:hypothetical protein EI94DRAFT_1345136 [Lactarius quietus]|nr:hypothetical protein EI94DRAFT_1345136 [Lactarius quietus]